MKYFYIKNYIVYPIYLWLYNYFYNKTFKEIEFYSSNEKCTLTKAHDSDACFDIQSSEHYIIPPGTKEIVATGLYFKLPNHWEAQIRSRSGLAAKNSIFVLNSPGTIDEKYRGEVKVIIFNAGDSPFEIKPYERIAQVKFDRVPKVRVKRSINNFSMDTDRGQKGFGSSGK